MPTGFFSHAFYAKVPIYYLLIPHTLLYSTLYRFLSSSLNCVAIRSCVGPWTDTHSVIKNGPTNEPITWKIWPPLTPLTSHLPGLTVSVVCDAWICLYGSPCGWPIMSGCCPRPCLGLCPRYRPLIRPFCRLWLWLFWRGESGEHFFTEFYDTSDLDDLKT